MKKDKKDGKIERGRRSYCKNKINPLIGKNSNFEVSVSYYIIYKW